MIRMIKDMNVQSQKFKLIEWLVGIQDVSTLKQLNEIREEIEKNTYESNLKPMTVEELETRIEASNRAILSGKVHDIEKILD